MHKNVIMLGTHGIPARHGGFETCAEKLALYLTSQGWRVTVFGCGEATRKSQWQGITCRALKTNRGYYLAPLFYDLRAVWVACRLPGLILTFGYNTACFNFILKLLGRRQIINMDGIEWQRPKYKKWHEKAWLKFNEWCALKIADIVIADHPAIAAYLSTRRIKVQIETIAYGADTVDPDIHPPGLLAVFDLTPHAYGLVIARPEPENQILEIVTAWRHSGTPQKLVILGRYTPDNPYHRAVLALADEQIMFVGALFDSNIVNALRVHARVYLHGHTVGGTNPSLIEALAAGCTIIAHDNIYNRGVAVDAAYYFSDGNDLSMQIRALGQAVTMPHLKAQAIERHQQSYQWLPVLQHYERLLARQL